MPRRSVEDPGGGDALARVAVALGHPLRVRIIRALVAGPGSATTLSKVFDDATVGDLYYHLTVLERCRVIELRRLRPVRGAKERIFELRRRAWWGDVWDSLPPSAVAAFQNAWIREFAGLAAAALDSGAIERRPSSVLTARPMRIDEQGFTEVSQTLRAALAEVDRIADESRQRLEVSEAVGEVNTVVGAAAFEAAPADWWETRDAE